MNTKKTCIDIEIIRKSLANPRCEETIRYDLLLSSNVAGKIQSERVLYFTDKIKTVKQSGLFFNPLSDTAKLVDGGASHGEKDLAAQHKLKEYVEGKLHEAFSGWGESVKSIYIQNL